MRAEVAFEKMLEGQGIRSSSSEDRIEHWDFKFETKVDVKRIKSPSRGEPKDENIHWVETRNVSGNHGWLYGEADLFAFETEDYFVLVGKQDLQNFIESIPKVFSSNKELYKFYSRPGRKDEIVLVKTLDLAFLGKIVKK